MKNGTPPAFMKKGQFLYLNFKIVNIFATKAQADSARESQYNLARTRDSIKAIAQLSKDDKVIAEYLLKNKIDSVKKAPAGTYVQILAPGSGEAIDTSKIVKVNYTGRALSTGKVFDSNTDTAFNHVEPIKVTMNIPAGRQGSVIKGWTDGLTLMKKGGKAKFYIPSALGYGSRGAGQDIMPNENLVFEVEVVDIITAVQAKAEADAEKKKYEDMQKKMMESMSKQKDTAKTK